MQHHALNLQCCHRWLCQLDLLVPVCSCLLPPAARHSMTLSPPHWPSPSRPPLPPPTLLLPSPVKTLLVPSPRRPVPLVNLLRLLRRLRPRPANLRPLLRPRPPLRIRLLPNHLP